VTTRLTVVDGAGFAKYVDASVEVYVVAMSKPRTVVPARQSITLRHLSNPGLRAVLAENEDGLIGFAYGYYGEPGQWWHDAVADAMSREQRQKWLANAYEIAEVHVLPAWQQQGLGRRMLHQLCHDVPRQTVVLSAIDDETPARRLYRAMGFVDLLSSFAFAGSTERYAVMGRPLPLDEAPSPRL
jgi:ribosomal protein S18 acetylase RimI-like enzyme